MTVFCLVIRLFRGTCSFCVSAWIEMPADGRQPVFECSYSLQLLVAATPNVAAFRERTIFLPKRQRGPAPADTTFVSEHDNADYRTHFSANV